MDRPVSWHTVHDGWVQVESDQLRNALRNTINTPWEISAFTGDMIVPTWVLDAVREYHEAGGFAGLSLFEYLDRISDGQNKEPLHSF